MLGGDGAEVTSKSISPSTSLTCACLSPPSSGPPLIIWNSSITTSVFGSSNTILPSGKFNTADETFNVLILQPCSIGCASKADTHSES